MEERRRRHVAYMANPTRAAWVACKFAWRPATWPTATPEELKPLHDEFIPQYTAVLNSEVPQYTTMVGKDGESPTKKALSTLEPWESELLHILELHRRQRQREKRIQDRYARRNAALAERRRRHEDHMENKHPRLSPMNCQGGVGNATLRVTDEPPPYEKVPGAYGGQSADGAETTGQTRSRESLGGIRRLFRVVETWVKDVVSRRVSGETKVGVSMSKDDLAASLRCSSSNARHP